MKQKGGATIMVERDDLIITPPSLSPSQRAAHFLTPSLTSSDALSFDLPLSTFRSNHNSNNSYPNVSFKGWIKPGGNNWTQWVTRMQDLHHATWLRAGILQPILSSSAAATTTTTGSVITPNQNLLLGLAERWCPLTNSFVFPWGEATVTLEDILLLASYPVLGSTAQIQPEDEDSEVLSELTKARAELNKTSSKKVSISGWTRVFMGAGGHTEHVAFLVLWLSRHVFPFAHDVVGKHLHTMAACLARGTKIALAPAILAHIYRDLTLFKRAIGTKDKGKVLNLWSQMHLIQIWAWERFPSLCPRPYPKIEEGESRIARWNKVTKKISCDIAVVRSEINSASERFVWRPYADLDNERCWQLHKFYLDKEKRVSVGPGMREDFRSFAKIVRVSELVGIDCIEHYYPHRVSMQFGMDQDIPGQVVRSDETPEIAWSNYDRPITDEKLYVPGRGFKSGVTLEYLEWWEQMKLVTKKVVGKVKDSKKSKRVAELLDETRPVYSSKKRKVIVEDVGTSYKKPKAGKSIKSLRRERKGKERLELTDEIEVPDDCMSSSGVGLHMEIENDQHTLETAVNNVPNSDIPSSSSSSLLACNNDVQESPSMETTEVEENTTPMQDETGNEINDGNHIHMESVAEQENASEDEAVAEDSVEVRVTIERENENEKETAVNEVPNSDIPSSSLPACNDENGNGMNDGDRLSRTQSPPLACNGNDINMGSQMEGENVCENTVTGRDEVVAENAVETRARTGGDGGVGVNMSETETDARSTKMAMLRAWPLEARIGRLERLVARLKERKMGIRSVQA